ncbi:hypothetical protein AKJ16_DCAP26937 [Drosera capensis]
MWMILYRVDYATMRVIGIFFRFECLRISYGGDMIKLMGSDSENAFALLDRNKCLSVGAAAVKASLPDSVVDLKSPELCVLDEFLPVSGVPNGAIVAAVSVLPGNPLSIANLRLCVKALTFESKGKDPIC